MSIDLDLHIDVPERTVDMKAGLETLQGTSDAVRTIAETVLSKKVPKRLNSGGNVRTNLKNSFTGSWVQIFSLDVYADESIRELSRIGGANVLVDLIRYFMIESVYGDSGRMTLASSAAIEALGEMSGDLIDKLRQSPMKKLHKASEDFGYDVTLRHRQSDERVIALCKFDSETAEALSPSEVDSLITFTAGVTRLNIFTGNGRLQRPEEQETTAFGFAVPYREVAARVKRKLSSNLNENNSRSQYDWVPLTFTARPLSLRSGKVVKYLVTAVK